MGWGGGGGGVTVQACPRRDQIPVLRSRVSGQEEEKDEWDNLEEIFITVLIRNINLTFTD